MKSPPDHLYALILAAGNANRMGRPKQSLIWKGETLLTHAIQKIRDVVHHYLVVLGANNELISPLVPDGHSTVNQYWKGGMGTSIAHGVSELEKKFNPSAILIQLVDQPLLKKRHFEKLIERHLKDPKKIICTAYENKAGVPAIFPQSFFEDLKTLKADFGARNLLNEMKKDIVMVKPHGQLLDLDTPEDYASLLALDSSE